jgi:hypothetical protein
MTRAQQEASRASTPTYHGRIELWGWDRRGDRDGRAKQQWPKLDRNKLLQGGQFGEDPFSPSCCCVSAREGDGLAAIN